MDVHTVEAAALRVLDSCEIRGLNAPILIDCLASGHTNFILSTYIEGQCCGDVITELSPEDWQRLVTDLRLQFESLHGQTATKDHSICNAAGKVIEDPRLPWLSDNDGDVSTVQQFFRQVWHGLNMPHNQNTIRPLIEPVIERDVPVVFCHGDLVPRNLIFPGGLDAWRNGQSRLCVIDWEYAGWMPHPWEALKATFVEFEADTEWTSAVRFILPQSGLYLDADWTWRSKSRMMLV